MANCRFFYHSLSNSQFLVIKEKGVAGNKQLFRLHIIQHQLNGAAAVMKAAPLQTGQGDAERSADGLLRRVQKAHRKDFTRNNSKLWSH